MEVLLTQHCNVLNVYNVMYVLLETDKFVSIAKIKQIFFVDHPLT